MGIKCASDVFQRDMVHYFGALKGVEIVVDDILIHGKDMGPAQQQAQASTRQGKKN